MAALLSTAAAKPVDPSVLSRIAGNFFPGRTLGNAVPLDGMYLVGPVEGDGFVLLSADDCVRPVLAFSPNGVFRADAMPDHVRQWLDGYSLEIASVVAAGIGQTPQVAAEWDYWTAQGAKSVGDSVAPMLTTAWNQGYGFNTLCPYDTDDSVRTPSGCVATATAQIMNYWQHPSVGWGSHAYYHTDYGLQSANFGATNYRWSLMPDTVDWQTSDSAIAAVSELMYHVGVSVDMHYGVGGSGAYINSYGSATRPSAENALKTYFKYTPMLYSVYKSDFSDAEWDALLRSDIDAGRPVLYSGHDPSGGHAFVFDGYSEMGDSLASRLFFHVNWGWGGHYDGYYTTDSLSPGAGGIGGNATYTFNLSNSAVIGIEPATSTSDSLATISVVPDNYAHGTVTGSGVYRTFSDQVTIRAHAAEGYRFVRWRSGSTQNPMNFVANGDLTDTAVFERLSGDTLGYCFDGLITSWADDYGSTTEWGIRIPAVMRGAGRSLTAVQFYPYNGGDFTLKVYIGASIGDSSLVYTQMLSVDPDVDPQSWNTFMLDSAVVVPTGATVWLTLSYTGYGVFPATMSRYSGNSDGSWYHLPEGWTQFDVDDVIFGSWMLRGVFAPRTINIAVHPADPDHCSTYGEGTYMGGDVVTIGAIVLDGNCTFSHWTDGSTSNPYSFIASDDTLMIAYCNCNGLGIDDVEGDEWMVAGAGLHIESSREAVLYDLQGRRMGQGTAFVVHAPGVYILRADGSTRKVVVMN